MKTYTPEEKRLLAELHHLAQAVNLSRTVQHGDRIAYSALSPALERAVARAQNVFEPYGLTLMSAQEMAAIHRYENPTKNQELKRES